MTLYTENADANSLFILDVTKLQPNDSMRFVLTEQWLSELLSQCEYKIFSSNATCELNITKNNNGISIQGPVHFRIETNCGTCFNKLKLDLSAHIDTFMQPHDGTSADVVEKELTPEDLATEIYFGSTIILDELIGDSILLELPLFPRCNGSCKPVKGLVTAEQVEQRASTVDPRLAALADIKLSKES